MTMSPILVTFETDQAAAIRAGYNEAGRVTMPVNAFMLTEAQREILLTCPFLSSGSEGYSYHIAELRVGGMRVDLAVPPAATASMEAVAAILDARAAAIAAYQAQEAAKQAEKAARGDKAIASALAEPDEKWFHEPWGLRKGQIELIVPHMARDYKDDPRILARLAELRPELQRRLDAAAALEAEGKANLAAQKERDIEAARVAKAEREQWIAKHGSERLQRLLQAGIEHDAVYRDERLARDLPHWRWNLGGSYKDDPPRNATEAALDLLDGARLTRPDAELRWVTLYRKAEEHEYEEADKDGDVVDRRFYAAQAEFLDRTIWLFDATDDDDAEDDHV